MSILFRRLGPTAKPIAAGASAGAAAVYHERSGSEQQHSGRVPLYAEPITLSGAKNNAGPDCDVPNHVQRCVEGNPDEHISGAEPVLPRVTVSAAQFDAAYQILAENPDRFAGILGDRFLPNQSMIERALRDREVRAAVKREVHLYNREAPSLIECPSSGDIAKQWDELCAKYGCSICRDVRAAPVVLACTHSFCYSCVRDLKDTVTVEDDSIVPSARSGVEVVHTCPECRKAIEGTENFARDYDLAIYEAVQCVPACSMKTDYEVRRNLYFEHQRAEKEKLREKLRATEEARADSGGPGTNTVWSVLSSMLVGDAEQAAEEEEAYQLFTAETIPYLVSAVITIVVVVFYGYKPNRSH